MALHYGGGGGVVTKKKGLVVRIKLPPLQNSGQNLNNQRVVLQQAKPIVEAEADADSTLVKPTSGEAVVKGGDHKRIMKQDLEEEKKLRLKKHLVIKIKLPPQQNQGRNLNNQQVIPQETKPTIAVEQDSTMVNPKSEEAVVKGGDDPSNKPMKEELNDEDRFQLKLEATKRKLQQRYQQAKDSKKRIRLVDVRDAPKQDLLDGSNKKPRNRYRW